MLGHVTELGYTDLVGQLHMALSQFAGVRAGAVRGRGRAGGRSTSLAIGPLDYLFLKKVVGRMELTWLTFPAGGAGVQRRHVRPGPLAQGEPAAAQPGRSGRLGRRVGPGAGDELVDALQPAASIRSIWPCGPIRAKSARSRAAAGAAVVDGGAGQRAVGSGAGGRRGDVHAALRFFAPARRDSSICRSRMWSTRSLLARWWAEAPSPLVAQLTDRGDHMLGGTLTLPAVWPLTDCVLVYDRWAYPLVDRPAGDTIDVDEQLEPQTVETYFRHVDDHRREERPRALRSDVDRSGPDPGNDDVPRPDRRRGVHRSCRARRKATSICRAWCGWAGRCCWGVGREPATHAAARARRADDTSRRRPADASWSIAEGQRLTFYRFVLPVASSAATDVCARFSVQRTRGTCSR